MIVGLFGFQGAWPQAAVNSHVSFGFLQEVVVSFFQFENFSHLLLSFFFDDALRVDLGLELLNLQFLMDDIGFQGLFFLQNLAFQLIPKGFTSSSFIEKQLNGFYSSQVG